MENRNNVVLKLQVASPLWNDYFYNTVFIQLDGTLQKPVEAFLIST